MVQKALFFIELGVGIIAGFAIWSVVSPHLTQVNVTPNA